MIGEVLNNTILCVDDEDGILDFYRSVLAPAPVQTSESILTRRARRRGGVGEEATTGPTLLPGTRRSYNLITASSGEEAVEKVKEVRAQGGNVAVGFFDMKMPGGIDGFETIQIVKALDPQMLVAVVTAYTDRAIAQIATAFANQDEWIYFNKPFTEPELLQAVNSLVHGWNLRREREQALLRLEESHRRLKEAHGQLYASYRAVIRALLGSLEKRDPYTAGHSQRVAFFSQLIGRRMGLQEMETTQMYDGCLLHDIGKLSIDDAILRKPGKLSFDEYEAMKTHPVAGAELLEQVGALGDAVQVVRNHHERWDGRGYPDKLLGAGIPLGARIVAVADTFDALTSTRSYREARGMLAARQVLVEVQGSQHDREISQAFVALIDEEPDLILSRIAPEAIRGVEVKDPGVCPVCADKPV